jgi:hypothetical protein
MIPPPSVLKLLAPPLKLVENMSLFGRLKCILFAFGGRA